jgi:two-component system chemotaxis response regulator CheY
MEGVRRKPSIRRTCFIFIEGEGNNAKIMIVDDYRSVRLLYREILSLMGHEIVAEAGNGYDALASYFQCSPDLLIIEHHMKTMKGMDVVREIKKRDRNAKILMCVSNSKEILAEASKLGVTDILTKPFSVDSFIHSVNKALQSED